MPRYIDADALVSILGAKEDMATGTPKVVFASVQKMIDLLPTADVVKVVRCKDCVHKTTDRMCDHDEIYCICFDCYKHEDGFCEEGRKEQT